MNTLLLLLTVLRVSLGDLDAGGWTSYSGRQVCIEDELVVCGIYKGVITLSPERLYVPEERAPGLSEGDSTAYWSRVAYNASKRISLECRYPYSLNLGATVKGLQATVVGDRKLVSGQQPHFRNYVPSKRVPHFKDADMVVCGANIENYFVHLGGYATRRITPEQHALQRLKVASALCKLDADVYALCELEKGPSAPADLVAAMDEVCHKSRYAFVETGARDGDTISVGYIYRKDRVRPYGHMYRAYEDEQDIYAYRFLVQGFEHIATGERFAISLNHLRSKRGGGYVSNARRMENTGRILECLASWNESEDADEDVLLLGDYNCYTYEEPLQTLVKVGYADMLAGDSLHYTYSYKGECGSLDRVFASESMAARIVGVAPVHWNTDYYYSAGYKSRYNYKVKGEGAKGEKLELTGQAKKNILFRYSDHDPVVIGIKLKGEKL